MSGLIRSVGFRVPAGSLSCVTSIGSDVWDRLVQRPAAGRAAPVRRAAGRTHHAVSTPGDLLFHIRAAHQDQCFELASQIMNVLDGAATVVDEVHGFKYFEMRDLLGFVDGTENPTGAEAQDAVLIGDEDPDFAGGSYVIVQKYLHDLKAWNALTVEQQEHAVGRTQARGHRDGRRRQAEQRPHRAERDRGRGRQRAADPARQHAVRHASGRRSSAPTSSGTPRRRR